MDYRYTNTAFGWPCLAGLRSGSAIGSIPWNQGSSGSAEKEVLEETVTIHWEALAWLVFAGLALWFVVLPLVVLLMIFLTLIEEKDEQDSES